MSSLTTGSLCSLSRRLKAGVFIKNSIIYKIAITQIVRLTRFVRKKSDGVAERLQYYWIHSGLWEKTWGIMVVELVFCGICLVLIGFFFLKYEEVLAFIVILVLFAVLAILSCMRVKHKLERAEIVDKINGIVVGDTCRVNEEHLSLENAELAHAVNEIGEGIQKAVEKSIRDERLKAELLTNVSHDIKTPLTSIINYVDLLKKEKIESEKAAEYIEVLENKSQKLKNLIQDLIEVSKISTGNIEYEMVPLNIHELIMQALGEYAEKFDEHCLKLIYNNEYKDAMIYADSRRMWRVIENLFSNVYKYALEGTRVYVEINKDDEMVCIAVKNISAKELYVKAEDLTERFVRGDLSRTTEGSGLGLAIAQNLIIGQGGNLKIMTDGDLFKVEILFKLLKN